MRALIVVASSLLLLACGTRDPQIEIISGKEGLQGTITRISSFPSKLVQPRNVDVWVPPSYTKTDDRFPVLYFHDGQNIFYPEIAYGNREWDVDGVISDLIEKDSIPEMIVVGIWNSPNRMREYFPEDASAFIPDSTLNQMVYAYGEPLGNEYLSFLTEELKPWVDQRFRTIADRESTYIMGSSMGGLISLYANVKSPIVFSKAICVSTHWPAAPDAILKWLNQDLPAAGDSYYYFDYGTEGLDAEYEPFQLRANQIFIEKGFEEGVHFSSFRFNGADHNENSWNERLPFIFKTVFGK
jgi:predicted alpha/beta superfamily hydrolase